MIFDNRKFDDFDTREEKSIEIDEEFEKEASKQLNGYLR